MIYDERTRTWSPDPHEVREEPPKTEWQLLAEMQEFVKSTPANDPARYMLTMALGCWLTLTPERVRETYAEWQKVKG